MLDGRQQKSFKICNAGIKAEAIPQLELVSLHLTCTLQCSVTSARDSLCEAEEIFPEDANCSARIWASSHGNVAAHGSRGKRALTLRLAIAGLLNSLILSRALVGTSARAPDVHP